VRYKLLSLLAVGFTLGCSPLVRAADLPLKAPLMAPQSAYNWAGWYAGGNIGYGWGDSSAPNLSFVDPAALVGFAAYFGAGGNVIPNPHPDGVVGGGQIGFNWQMSPNWVAGLVADFQASGMKAGASNTVTPPALITSVQSNSENIDWFGTVRAKFGYAQNNWLLYATGGLAYGQVATAGSFVGPGSPLAFAGSTSTTKAGWAAGAGLNYGLTRNWIVGVEYLYVDLGRVSYVETTQSGVAPGASLSVSNRAATQVARVSLDYKF
jgi:outer membrane immunogenic protein